MGRRWMLPLPLVLVMLSPATAGAAVVERVGSEIRYIAAPGEVNQAESEVVPGAIVVHEFNRSIQLQPGAGCVAAPDRRGSHSPVECPSDGVTHVRFEFGDLNDRHTAGYDTGALVVHLFGGDGDDALLSRDGNDVIEGGPGNDMAGAGHGLDQVSGGSGNDSLGGGDGLDQVSGGPGNDELGDNDQYLDHLDGGEGDDDLTGGEWDDLLIGGPGDDNLIGDDGNDRLDGGAGDDKLDGGRGDDVLDAGAGEDDVDGERGDDRLVTSDTDAEHSLMCGQGADRLEADARDPVNVDCEGFDGGTLRAGRTSLRPLVACPGTCANGRVVLTAGRVRIGKGSFGARASVAQTRSSTPRVRLTRRARRMLRRGRALKVRARIVARDTTGRVFRSRGRYVIRRR